MILTLIDTGSLAGASGMKAGFNRLMNAVVRIDVREIVFEDGLRRYAASIGSGVIVSADGLVLTNAHVVSPRAVEVSVTLANLERVGASLVGWDHWTDLALLRIDREEVQRRGLKFDNARFGDSDKLYAGETVFAVGTPHGLTRTVTRGIISNTQRFEDSETIGGYETGVFNTWLQTDAAINPGNSGGPLVTEEGEVIGINSRAYVGADNLGFAIPGNIAQRVADELKRGGKIQRSYIGLVPAPLQDLEQFYALKLNSGLLINSVDPGSPAAKAGLRGGDIVLALDGAPVDGRFPEQLPAIQNVIANQSIGRTLVLSIKRGEQLREVNVTTEKLESRQGEEWAFEKWGLSVRKISRAYARENQLSDETGAMVIGLQSGLPAAIAGLARGDVIRKINDRAVTSLDVMREAQSGYSAKPAPLLVETLRDRRVSLYVIKP